MLKLRTELLNAIELNKLVLQSEQDKNIKTQFNVGTLSVNVKACSDSQLLYLLSLLSSRLEGSKIVLGSKPELHQKCLEDIADVKTAIKYVEKVRKYQRLVMEDDDLLIELESLLTNDEKRELFTNKAKSIRDE